MLASFATEPFIGTGIFTIGASFADWTGKSRHTDGIGLGDGPAAFVLAALIVAGGVVYLTTSRVDQDTTA